MDFSKLKTFLLAFVFLLSGTLFIAGCGGGGGSSSNNDSSGSSGGSPTVSSKLSGSLTVENNTAATTNSKPVSYKAGQSDSAPRMAATTSCENYRIYFNSTSTGVQGSDYFTLTSNATTGGCDISGSLPDPGTYDVILYTESTQGSGTFDVEEAVLQLMVTVEDSVDFQANITFDEGLKIVNMEMVKVGSDGTKSDVPKSGNTAVTEIAAFPDISGVYTVQFKRSDMDKYQAGTDDAVDVDGGNDGGWEESFYVGIYEGNLKNPQTYEEISDTLSKRMSVWIDKSYRDGCYALNNDSDVISTYAMTDADGNTLTINSTTTSDDLYTFMEAKGWLPAALTSDLGSAQTVDDTISIDCANLMPLLKPFYDGATVDSDSGYCTALLTGAQGVALTDVQTYLSTLSGTEMTMASQMLESMLFATNQGPPHPEWCRDYHLVKGDTGKVAEFTNFMIGMCEMHTKGDESLMIKRDIVRQFFDIFAEVKREPRSDKKMDALADFIQINGISSSNFATKMADDDILKTFLNIMSQMPCFDDGCKSWKRALKLALNNLTTFKDGTLCDSFVFSEDNFCFTFAEFTQTSTTMDVVYVAPTSGSKSVKVRTKSGATWGAFKTITEGTDIATDLIVQVETWTMADFSGTEQSMSETRLRFKYSGDTYDLGFSADRPDEINGDYVDSSGQHLGVFGRKVNVEQTGSETRTTYRIKSGGGMAEHIDEMACGGGYHPVAFSSIGANVQAIFDLSLPSFDGSGGPGGFTDTLANRTDIGDWYEALVNLSNSAEVAEGCGKKQLKMNIEGIFWSLQGPGMDPLVLDPDDVQSSEIAIIKEILNGINDQNNPPSGGLFTAWATAQGGNAATWWSGIIQNLIQSFQVENIFWTVSSIQQELGYEKIKDLFASATIMATGKNLEQLDATDMAAYLGEIRTFDKQGHWSWIWGDEETTQQQQGNCFGMNPTTCVAWTATRLAADGMRGGTNLEEVKFRLRDARRRFALEEDDTFRQKINDIVANSACIPDITFKDEPEIAADGTIKFKLNLRGPSFRLLDSELNFKKDSNSIVKYFVTDANMEVHQEDMNTTCVFGEKKEISNIPLPTTNSNSKYVFNGLFMRAFFDGCGQNKDLQDADSSSESQQGESTEVSAGNDRYREIQSFIATQD